ncbi:hypothetical protein IQ07DRAFT_530563 [Pyrenochaeta sp. DS3sAY3a]|nr:hypothetical protein IQ07DRAFT_530563 [Pyrenochaeta sp. DS3sAY3a]
MASLTASAEPAAPAAPAASAASTPPAVASAQAAAEVELNDEPENERDDEDGWVNEDEEEHGGKEGSDEDSDEDSDEEDDSDEEEDSDDEDDSDDEEDSDEDDDPIVAEYDVYITPDDPARQIYVLQYVNREPNNPLTAENNSHPVEMRIKPEAGFIEVDVPIDVTHNYDRVAGVKYGEALRKTKGFGQKAYGIASGFERTMPRAANRSGEGPSTAPIAPEDDDNIEDYVNNFEDANEKGHVLNVQTYGGQIFPQNPHGPTYMVGTFRDNELHLSKIDAIVQLRTQFHHIDATSQLDAAARRREKESQEGTKPAEPKAFLPTVKNTGGDTPAETTAAFMKAAHQEPWTRLQYHDENSDPAFDQFQDRLFLKNTAEAPKLRSTLNNAQFLDAISAKPGRRGGKGKAAQRAADEELLAADSDIEEMETTVS